MEINWQPLYLTAKLALLTTGILLVIGIPLAYLLSIWNSRFKLLGLESHPLEHTLDLFTHVSCPDKLQALDERSEFFREPELFVQIRGYFKGLLDSFKVSFDCASLD